MNRYLGLLLCFCLVPGVVLAGDAASFESFYRTSSSISWVLAGLAALAVVGIVIATGGTASPLIMWFGTLVGNAMGLSGAAATKAGLALLGGGSLASGGFGMLGGTVLLTAALSFSTDVIVDYGVGRAVSEYQYRDLVARSQGLSTLPLPTNTTGPAAYKEAIETLKEVNVELPLHAESNLALIKSAIEVAARGAEDESLADEDQIRLATLVSLLKFQTNEYLAAKDHASRALARANSVGVSATLPAFIYATSGLYEDNFDFDSLTDTYLRHAVLRESSNKLIPLLFAIYLDRTMLRMDQGDLGPEAFTRVFGLMEEPALKDHRVLNLMALATRYFMLVRHEQLTVADLATTANDTLRNAPTTLARVEQSLENYSQLLADLEPLLDTLGAIIPRLNRDATTQWEEFVQLHQSYLDDKDRLAGLIAELAAYQAEQARLAEEARIAEEERLAAELQRQQARANLVYWLIGLVFVVAVFLFMRSARKGRPEKNKPAEEAS